MLHPLADRNEGVEKGWHPRVELESNSYKNTQCETPHSLLQKHWTILVRFFMPNNPLQTVLGWVGAHGQEGYMQTWSRVSNTKYFK